LATQGATAPQGPLVGDELVGDEEGELTVFVLADVAEDEGVLLGDAGVELVPDKGVDETVGTDAPLPDSALLMDAA
jgi:hypothetical protein